MPLSARTLTELLKQKALALGFSKVGIASAVNLQGEYAHLMEWISRGYNATMEWMARNPERRANPLEVLHGARSVLSVAMDYFPGDQPVAGQGKAYAKISRYAWGDDYHEVVTERLREAEAWLSDMVPGIISRVYVDTGPVMEKAWAARSGVGWLGKHTNVITREFGSYVFLGELITTVELEYDAPALDHCGSCNRCLEACPTGAIVEPCVLDSSKCISYLTIEHRGDIPDELADKFDGWMYGCDICQEVCPWNRFAKMTQEPAFRAREQNVALTAAEAAEIGKEEFQRRFKKSPVKRTKHSGFVRNARVLLAHRK